MIHFEMHLITNYITKEDECWRNDGGENGGKGKGVTQTAKKKGDMQRERERERREEKAFRQA